MTEAAAKKTNAKEPETQELPNPAQPAPGPTIRCAVVPQETMRLIEDFVRDAPVPRKVSDPVQIAINRIQYADFPMGPQG